MPEADKHELQQETAGGKDQSESITNLSTKQSGKTPDGAAEVFEAKSSQERSAGPDTHKTEKSIAVQGTSVKSAEAIAGQTDIDQEELETLTAETPETSAPNLKIEKPVAETPETDAKALKAKGPEDKTDSQSTQNSEDSEDTEDSEDSDGDIDKTNAEDAEDAENQRRHQIPFLDYHSLSMENLVGELQRLMRTEKLQSIRRHVETIRREFDLKFQEFLEEKKEEFVSRGGELTDFNYNSVTKRQFNELYSEYRDQRTEYYKNLEKQLKQNLEDRLTIIEELKGLVSVEEDMNSTYKSFKALQERWKKAGPVPRAQYSDVWRTYQHHLEIFYDFLSLNRELRDLDFKFNLEEKEKLSLRAENLLQEQDINKAFRELQILHKIWKEDIGPVAKEHREAIWERFSEATRKMHDRRQGYFEELDKRYLVNLEEKQKIIARIDEVSSTVAKNHKGIQQQIQEVETLRDRFFKTGKVPQKDNETTWASFKTAVRKFNRSKNAFYKNLKKEQQVNLDLKKSLLQRATDLKDNEDWDSTTSEMKKIQREWKEIGHVPRKYSDAIWKEFKTACNHYFDRLHSSKSSAFDKEKKNFELKMAVLDQLRAFQLTGNREKDLKTIQAYVEKWKEIGHVPRNKKHVISKFQKILDALFRKMNVGKQEAEILMYGDRIAHLAKEDDSRAIEQERQFIRKKIEDVKGEIRQLENNLNFFSEPSEENPLVKEVLANLEKKKKGLESWKSKMKKLNIMRNSLKSEAENTQDSEDEQNENAS